MTDNNVVLTGIPRSGTTLTCHLLNKLSNTVALHEPLDLSRSPQAETPAAMVDTIERFFESMRQSIKSRKVAFSKHVYGRVPDNPVANQYSDSGLRSVIVSRGEISIEKDLTDDFLLVIKQ